MNILKRLRYLLPAHRAADEREMARELDSLRELAGPKELGNLTLAAENARAVWGWVWLDGLFGDLRYALRLLARQPSFTAVAVISLGLGIGANAAIYSLMDRVLWRQLPVADPERLVTLSSSYSTFAFDRFRQFSKDTLTDVALTSSPLARDVNDREARVELVSGNFFELLGVQAGAGRTLTAEDDRRGQPQRVAVLSYRYWQRAFAANPVLGQTIRVTRLPFTIVGIAPPEFFGVTVGDATDVWVPLSTLPDVLPGRDWLTDPHTNYARIVGRLRPGVTAQAGGAALTPVALQIELERSGDLPPFVLQSIRSRRLTLLPLASGLSTLRTRFSKPLRVVFAMVAIGLLLACVNVMSLQFARAGERRRELSVRLAIGAGRARVVRQLLTEAALVSLLGGALGLAIRGPAAAALSGLISMYGEPVHLDLPTDWTVLGFVVAVSFAAAFVCGLIPALRATRVSLSSGLQQGSGRMTAGPSRRISARAVAALQIALSVVLVAGAFLFAFSLRRLMQSETGVNRRHLLVLDVDPKEARDLNGQVGALSLRLLERLRQLPGVEVASFSQTGIYSGRSSNNQAETDEFRGTPGPQRDAYYDNVGPGYFAAVGARLVAGRDFTDRDNKGAPKVCVVGMTFARHFFPEGSPIGHTIYVGKNRDAYQVIGVAEDVRHDVRANPRRMYYLAEAQTDYQFYTVRFLIRTSGEPGGVARQLRAVVREESAALRVDSIHTADELLNRTLDLDRLVAALAFAFGVLAVTLAAVGVYGLLAYEVGRRTPEIGIRMALGATRAGVLRLVLGEVAWVGALGGIAGLGAAVALGRLVQGMVYELSPGDPRVLIGAIALLALAAVGAAAAPVRRATGMDPVKALRVD